MKFIDTNYFLRFFLGEPYDQHQEAKALFQKAARGEVELATSIVVFFEVYWVTSSFYRLEKEKIAAFLQNILRMEFIKLENRVILTEAAVLFEKTSFGLEDAYNLVYAHSLRAKDFLTFDAKLKKKSVSVLRNAEQEG